ncbi:MAG TPA: alpha/beta hydrolase-fold protein, partial [Tepidisphaeraceae bacterium]|nr:alpha/beta hydrolase-fold protein [Tepidisphaeraceae bacterium]
MRKSIIVFVVFLLAGLGGIGGWLLSNMRQSRAAAEQFSQWAAQQKKVPVEFDVTAPPATPVDQTLYISGDCLELGSWDAAGVPLHRGDDGHYRATLQLLSGIPRSFKITRGTWGTVERGAGGVDIADHTFTPQAGSPVQVSVLTWVDGGKTIPGQVTLTGIFRLHKKFESKILGNSRTLIVYLPPDYESNSGRRYPVLYMQDGQNLFDASTAFAGVEWRVDETAEDLIKSGRIAPVIIVGIYNSPDRTAEFTPFDKTPAGVDGLGRQYGDFLVKEVKPMIDRTYRTKPDRADTAIAGSSMGGL